MNKPQEINLSKDITIEQAIKQGKIQILILDGNEGTAHVLEAPEHGETIIQTIKGGLSRLDYRIGHKF
ncbi:XtrA/YqaO family protein [Bacillus subtilis]|uniref:XtrA/YqaO family protein n=1 Tax=Bacillus subtilis TaxID=1423 RepID=UPI002DB9566B|nr:XtrA/YqaO family protein [Bacillus subtilis]MEC1878360.1 XtrA/YqaO family protein [Bacillus subtilis]MEC1936645.1 XtrA/YqaO family protein [Bacillus subtilis]